MHYTLVVYDAIFDTKVIAKNTKVIGTFCKYLKEDRITLAKVIDNLGNQNSAS